MLPDVTVSAPAPPQAPDLAGEAVPDFIAAHTTVSPVIRQLTRWRNGICPRVQGLSPGYNAFAAARIEAVAKAVDAPLATGDRCEPNVQILFTTEPQQVLDEIMKRASRLLGFHYPHQVKMLGTVTRPIQGWYVTSTRNYRGIEQVDDPLPMPSIPGVFNLDKVPPGAPGSRLTSGRSSAIVEALVVVDSGKATGMTIGSISDYLAMLILTQAHSPETCSQLPSIIDLFASTCGARPMPTRITAGDIAFLRALYATDMEQPASIATSDIHNHMMREFGRL